MVNRLLIPPAMYFKLLQTAALFSILVTSSSASLSANDTDSTKTSVSCSEACTELSSCLGDSAVILRHPSVDDGISLWDQKQREVRPACRVVPSSSGDVADVLRVLRARGCRFAVHSGGHAQDRDASNSAGGITLDLAAIRTVQPLHDGSQVRLGAGHNLSSAYAGLEKLGLVTVLGHSAGVGIGGYTLGGGLSTLTHRYGFAMDNTYTYELVLPNSTILNVTYEAHPDLYYALRGGGPGANFGIVTHFTMLAVPATRILGGYRTYADSQTKAVTDELYELTTGNASSDVDGSVYTRYGYDAESDSFTTSVTQNYLGPVREPEIFAGLNSIPSIESTLDVGTHGYFAQKEAEGTPDGLRNLFGTMTYRPSAELDRTIFSVFKEETRALRNVTGFMPSIVSQPLYQNIFPQMKVRGGNAVGLDGYDGPLTLSLFSMTWSDSTDDARVDAMLDRLIERTKQVAATGNASVPWLYSNYGKANQNVFASYGKENHERLKKIQEAVDPEGIFTSLGLCRGSFKLR